VRGDWRLNEIAASNIEVLHHACTTAIIRRNARHGRHAAENLIDPRSSPAHRVSKLR
jgi:hypothetical protein